MTPEERFTKIENFLSTVAEHQAHHDEDIRELRQMQKGMTLAITKVAEAQQVTAQKLNALIDTVDRIIRRQGGQSS